MTVGEATKALWDAVNDLTNAINLGVLDTGGRDGEEPVYIPDSVGQFVIGPGELPPGARLLASDGDCLLGEAWRTSDGYTYNRSVSYAGCGGEPDGKAPLRREYEAAVLGLAKLYDRVTAAGEGAETIARKLHAARRALGVEFKGLTPPEMLDEIYERNLRKYGDRLGPSIEWLRQTKTWEEIIDSAMRFGGKDLRFR